MHGRGVTWLRSNVKAGPHRAGSTQSTLYDKIKGEELWQPPLVSHSEVAKALHSRQCMAGVLCGQKRTKPASTI